MKIEFKPRYSKGRECILITCCCNLKDSVLFIELPDYCDNAY